MRKPFALLLYTMIWIAGVAILVWRMSEKPAEKYAVLAGFVIALAAIGFAIGSLVLMLAEWLHN